MKKLWFQSQNQVNQRTAIIPSISLFFNICQNSVDYCHPVRTACNSGITTLTSRSPGFAFGSPELELYCSSKSFAVKTTNFWSKVWSSEDSSQWYEGLMQWFPNFFAWRHSFKVVKISRHPCCKNHCISQY